MSFDNVLIFPLPRFQWRSSLPLSTKCVICPSAQKTLGVNLPKLISIFLIVLWYLRMVNGLDNNERETNLSLNLITFFDKLLSQ